MTLAPSLHTFPMNSQLTLVQQFRHGLILCQIVIPTIRTAHPQFFCQTETGWWYTYPSEKYESQLG